MRRAVLTLRRSALPVPSRHPPLATPLWRQILPDRAHPPRTREFLTPGAVTVSTALHLAGA
jgi:hypothetical protein